MKKETIYFLGGCCVFIGIGLFIYFKFVKEEEPILFRTEEVFIGNIAKYINATGTLEPEELINVGAQVAGQIIYFGDDTDGKHIDFGSSVKTGQVLAQIDDALYLADVKHAEAALDSAKAQQNRTFAEMELSLADSKLAGKEFSRIDSLLKSGAVSASNFDTAKSTLERASANSKISKANFEQAKSLVAQAEANLMRAKQNLEYCTIKSPVDGVVIDRRVNVGQTVVSSMSSPSLFLLAKDLRKMQIWVSVNEADIGGVRVGMPAEFTVDTFPGDSFFGEVRKIRLNATLTQNVVTYTVEINMDNSNNKLLPYLTANVKLIMEQKENVPLLNNSALRWQPPTDLIDIENRPILDVPPPKAGETGYIWLLTNEGIKPHKLTLGLSDGIRTQIVDNPPPKGAEIVSGILSKEAAQKSRVSPFLPKARRRI